MFDFLEWRDNILSDTIKLDYDQYDKILNMSNEELFNLYKNTKK